MSFSSALSWWCLGAVVLLVAEPLRRFRDWRNARQPIVGLAEWDARQRALRKALGR